MLKVPDCATWRQEIMQSSMRREAVNAKHVCLLHGGREHTDKQHTQHNQQHNYTVLGVHKINKTSYQYNYTALTASGGTAVTPLTTYTCGINCKWRGVQQHHLHTHVALKWRGVQWHHLQHTRGIKTAMIPLTKYTCGIKTASEGECSDTTYKIHVWH